MLSKTSNGAITPWSPTPGPTGIGCLFLREARALSVRGTAIPPMPCTEMRIWVPMDAKRKATDPRDEAEVAKEIRSFFVFFIGVSDSGPSTKGPGLHVGAKAGTVTSCETFCR